MVPDGDSKAFNTVKNVYDECKVIKLDRVGHVQKRMGKHLLNLKARTKGQRYCLYCGILYARTNIVRVD